MPQPKSKQTTTDNFSSDHSFDVSEEFVKATNVLEQGPKNKMSGKGRHLSTEELLEVVLEPDDFIMDHTFDVNEAKLLDTPRKIE
jgi:hypothetical protein